MIWSGPPISGKTLFLSRGAKSPRATTWRGTQIADRKLAFKDAETYNFYVKSKKALSPLLGAWNYGILLDVMDRYVQENAMRETIYVVLRWLYFGSVALTGLLGIILKVWPANFSKDGEAHLTTAIGSLAVAQTVIFGAAKWTGPPWVPNAIRRILNRFRVVGFNIVAPQQQFYRVTVYQKKRWSFLGWWRWSRTHPIPIGHHESRFIAVTCSCLAVIGITPGFFRGRRRWPWAGWLIPIARSWEDDNPGRTIYLAPREAADAEGFIGRAWFDNRPTQEVNDLPDLNNDPTPADIQSYVHRCAVSAEWVNHRLARKAAGEELVFYRSFFTLMFEKESGEPWGIVLWSSPLENAIRISGNDPACHLAPICLAELLKQR